MEVPIKDTASNDKTATVMMRVPMVLPHELLCYLAETGMNTFKVQLVLILYILSTISIQTSR